MLQKVGTTSKIQILIPYNQPVDGIYLLNSCVVEESRDKQAERICNKNTHVHRL